MSDILKLISNSGLDLNKSAHYAAILGETPSKGAKSPVLWNASFQGLGMSGEMHPMDVVPAKLSEVVDALREDRRFIGGAVTMPFKIDILPFMDKLEPEATAIGAVNCIYRGEDGRTLVGANTDGAGALLSLTRKFGELANANVLLLGAGGASLAVAAYVGKALGRDGLLQVSNRNQAHADYLVSRVSSVCPVRSISWPPPAALAPDLDVIINCSAVGFEAVKQDGKGFYCLKFFTPLGLVPHQLRAPYGLGAIKEFARIAADDIALNIRQTVQFLAATRDVLVFDVVYQPRETLLLALSELMGLRTLSGVGMNLEQAVIAFDKATSAAGVRSANRDEVRRLMAEVW